MENQQQSVIKNTYQKGQIFGCYEILERTEPTKFKVFCINCKQEKVVSQANLVHSKKEEKVWCKNCKPTEANTTKYQIGDILGNCFKLLKNLGLGRWEVQCTKCQKVQEQNTSNMKHHKSEECHYCKNPNAQRNHQGGKGTIIGTIEERIYRYYKSRIDRDNETKAKIKPWDLNLEQFSELIRGNCYYCGDIPRENNMWTNSRKKMIDLEEDYSFNGIDRQDSNLGYNIENCVSCCWMCNQMKSVLPVPSFLSQISKIYEFNNKCSTTSS